MEKNTSSKIGTTKAIIFFIGGLLIGIIGTSGVMISKNSKKAANLSEILGVPLVRVDGKVWGSRTLPGDAGMEYYHLEGNIYNAQKNFVNQTAVRIALAKDFGKTVSATELPKIEELFMVPPVEEAEVRSYYDKLVSQMGRGAFHQNQSFEKVKAELQEQMYKQKVSYALTQKLEELEAKGRVQFLFEPPVSPPIHLELEGFPARGNTQSSTVLVEVADYLCAHCREAEVVLNKIYQDFSSKVKFVSVAYPLSPQGLSGALVRGGFCAFQQGISKYYDYSEHAFQVPLSYMQPSQGQDPNTAFRDVTMGVAKLAKLNVEEFSKCASSHDADVYIQKIQKQFNASTGFQGTPTFYLNGRLIQVPLSRLEATLRATLNESL
jgi:protein-disulfide isomerase